MESKESQPGVKLSGDAEKTLKVLKQRDGDFITVGELALDELDMGISQFKKAIQELQRGGKIKIDAEVLEKPWAARYFFYEILEKPKSEETVAVKPVLPQDQKDEISQQN